MFNLYFSLACLYYILHLNHISINLAISDSLGTNIINLKIIWIDLLSGNSEPH